MNVSGRNHHAVKVTVYLTPDEALRIDANLLEIRRRTGLRVDRGRYIREAIFQGSLSRIATRIKEAS